jgi:cytoskeletal protein RodZ
MEWNVGLSNWKVITIIIVIILVIVLIVYVCKVISRTNELADIDRPNRKQKKTYHESSNSSSSSDSSSSSESREDRHHKVKTEVKPSIDNHNIKVDNQHTGQKQDERIEVNAKHAVGCRCKRCYGSY